MFRALNNRAGHYSILLILTGSLFLPTLGVPSLWDIDEGNNAEAGREMLESGNLVIPTFNFQLRVDKPVLLYWLQILAYQLFGIGEFAARLPSALAAMLTALVTYELGRRLFDPATGLLGGVILASSVLFCGSAHFANPDALLSSFTVLTFLFFWHGYQEGHSRWLIWIGLSTGLGFLTKGPVGLVLPATVIGLFLICSRRLRLLWSRHLLLGWLVWFVVTVPWFALVGSETKGEYLRGFFLKHNLERYRAAMEGHGGPFYYHAVSLFLGLLPWSVFLIPALWKALKESSLQGPRSRVENSTPVAAAPGAQPPALVFGHRTLDLRLCFLFCWIGVYFLFFSLCRTKLPNYILPLYPAVALLLGWFLASWRNEPRDADSGWRLGRPAWLMPLGLAGWASVGVGVALTLLIAGGALEVPINWGQRLPGLEAGAFLGLFPITGAAVGWLLLRRQERTGALASLALSAAALAGGLACWGGPALDAHKAPRFLVEAAQARQPDRDIRVGCYEYFQPSLVFYCQREVKQLDSERQAVDFLRTPLPVYLFVPAHLWPQLEAQTPTRCRLLASHRCFYRNCDVVVVTNE